MKIAACFSGFTRNFEDTYPYFKKKLFDVYDVDVFVFGSPNKFGLEHNKDIIDNTYRPKKIILENDLFWSSSISLDQKYDFKDSVMRMWYNIMGSDNLRKEYENENNFKYDYVIRMRFDYFFLRTLEEVGIDLNEIDDNSVSIPYRWNFSEVHPKAKCDMFAIGTSNSMNKYCSLLKHIDKFSYSGPKNNRGTSHAESLLGFYLDSIGMNVIGTESPFEFEYPEEIDIGSNVVSYRSNYRKFAF
jgi:hypothetical protein